MTRRGNVNHRVAPLLLLFGTGYLGWTPSTRLVPMEYLNWGEGRARAINDTLGLYDDSKGNVDDQYIKQHLGSEDMDVVRRWVALNTENAVLVEGVVKRLLLIAPSGSIQMAPTEEALLRSSGTNSDTLAPEVPPVRYTNRHQKTNSTAVSMAHVTNLMGLWETPPERRMEDVWSSVKAPPPIAGDTISIGRYLQGAYKATVRNNGEGNETPLTDDPKAQLETAVGAVKFLVELQREEQEKLYTVIGRDINKFMAACYDLRTLLPGQVACRWNIQYPTHATLFRALGEVLENSAKYRAWLPRKMVMDADTSGRRAPSLANGKAPSSEERIVSVVKAEIVTRLVPKKEVLAAAMGLPTQLASNALLLSQGPNGMNGGTVPVVHLSGHDRASPLTVSVEQVSPGKAYEIFGLVRPEVSYAETISPQYMSDIGRKRDVYRWKNTFAREVRASKDRLQDLPRWLILEQRAKVMRQSQTSALTGTIDAGHENGDNTDASPIEPRTTNSPTGSTGPTVPPIEKLSLIEIADEDPFDQFAPKNIIRAPNLHDMKQKSRTIRDTTQSSFVDTQEDNACRRVEELPRGTDSGMRATQEPGKHVEPTNNQNIGASSTAPGPRSDSSWESVMRRTVKSTPVPRARLSTLRAQQYLSEDDEDDDEDDYDSDGNRVAEEYRAGRFW